ncbi:MAG: hypothetical protein GX591_17135 [Planctomycetes bacterium]|nr:hypothetical protein [Planctomycetota bacterium]
MRVAVLVAVLLAVPAGGGCRRVERPEPAQTAEALFEQASEALAAGRVEDAAALFARSLATADDVRRRRDAAVRLFAAGAADPALDLLADRQDPSLAAAREAMMLYKAAPPPGWRDNPYVVAAMSDALAAVGRLSGRLEPLAPVELGEAALGGMIRDWHTWARLAAGPSDGAGRSRTMVVWAVGGANEDAAAEQGLIIHPAGGGDGAGQLVHMGSWFAGGSAPPVEVVVPPAGSDGPVALVLATWNDAAALTVALLGERTEGGLVVTGCSHPALLAALLAKMADPDLAGGPYVLLRDPGESRAVAALAAERGAAGAVAVEGLWAHWTVAEADQTDFAADDSLLADLVGFVRYGRDAWPTLDR